MKRKLPIALLLVFALAFSFSLSFNADIKADPPIPGPCIYEQHEENCCIVEGTELWGVCVWHEAQRTATCHCDCTGPWVLCNGGPQHCQLDCISAGGID